MAANLENDYGPDENGGFVPIAAYDRADLLAILAKMSPPK